MTAQNAVPSFNNAKILRHYTTLIKYIIYYLFKRVPSNIVVCYQKVNLCARLDE